MISPNTELNGNSFYSNNTYIDEAHREYIINATWYTGGQEKNNYRLQDFVNGEKSTSATGYIGLMSVVDFGYAGSRCTTSTVITGVYNQCMNDNWIGYSNFQWTITPENNHESSVQIVHTGCYVSNNPARSGTNMGVRPTVYLDSNVKIKSGSGTENNPYILTQ